jgi:Flp pilus assembly CpaF family ATPase
MTVAYRSGGRPPTGTTVASWQGTDFERPWGDIDETVVYTVRSAVSDKLSARQARRAEQRLPGLARADEEQLVAQLASEELRDHARGLLERGRKPPTEAEERAILKAVSDLLFGMGRLQPYLDRPDVKNIHAQGARPVWLELLDGSTVQGAPIASSGDELIEWVRDLGRRIGLSERRFDPERYRINLQLPDGSRLFAIAWVTAEPHLFVRRHHFIDVSLDDLGQNSPMLRSFLRSVVRAGFCVIIAGGQGDGKTTLLRAMAAAMDPDERVTTIETDLELGLDRLPARHHEAVAMEARETNIEGVGQVTCAHLVRDAMRTNSRRVIVGEVLGDEVVPMLLAMNSGAKGSLCTIHADSSDDVFEKLGTLASLSPQRLDHATTSRLASKAVDFIVFVERDLHGTPAVVSSIREVTGFDGQPLTNELFTPGGDRHAWPAGVPVSDRRRNALAGHGFDPAWLLREDRI